MTTRAREPLSSQELERIEMESSRVRRSLDLAVAFQELVDVAARLPVGAGPSSVVKTIVDCLVASLPHRAIGACVVLGGAAEPILEIRLPPSVASPGRDPTRLFPDLEDEAILDLSGLRGSTLHVGSIRGAVRDEPAEVAFIERAANLLAAGVRTAVALRTARPVSAEVAELRAQVIQSEKLASLGQLVAGVVNELANPVTSIVACTDFLLHKRAGEPPEDIEHLKRIGVAAERILKFSRDLVAYARPATETPGPVSLVEVIAQAEAFCEHELAKNEVIVTLDFSEGSPPVLGQSGPLTQIFVNLFTNAAHAMSDHGGHLTVRTSVDRERDALVVEVTDTGSGIPPETIAKIFEPFFTTKEKGRGTGLGLSIVQEIVQAHAGQIEATSTLGEGTTFRLKLPLCSR